MSIRRSYSRNFYCVAIPISTRPYSHTRTVLLRFYLLSETAPASITPRPHSARSEHTVHQARKRGGGSAAASAPTYHRKFLGSYIYILKRHQPRIIFVIM